MLLDGLAALLLVLVSTYSSVGGDCDSSELLKDTTVVTALEGISGALHCFQDVFKESSRDNGNLRDLVLDLKGDITNLWSSGSCHISKVKEFAEEKVKLEIQLADINETVRELEGKLNSSQKQVDELQEKVKLLNNRVDPQDEQTKEACELAKQPGVAEQVEEFRWSRSWAALRQGLEAALSNKTAAFKQLPHVEGNGHELWSLGRNGYVDLAALLICGGLAGDASDADGDGMLHGAASSGHVRMVAALLDLGADIEDRGSSGGRTPLIWAANNDRLETVKLLVERGAALNASTNNGDTALHVAAREGYLVVVRLLVAAGANTEAVGNNGYTALGLAKARNHVAMARYLSQFPS